MIKDKLTEAIEAYSENIKNGDDRIPIGMRGELEVIVKDRDGNVKSYERDHNQVTKLAKMALLHLLAGEIGTVDNNVYSVPEVSSAAGLRAYSLTETSGAQINSSFNPDNHSSTINLDGVLVSGQPYFYDGDSIQAQGNTSSRLSQTRAYNNDSLKFNFPTKMLFGTGLEDNDTTTVENTYADDFGTRLSAAAILVLNGYSANYNNGQIGQDFFYGCSSTTTSGYDVSQRKLLSNWYSADAYRNRTLQPAKVEQMNSSPTSSDTAIKGAIKNCFIEGTGDSALYNPTTKMALAPYRGYGYPCFIYAERSTQSFYNNVEGNTEVHYGINNALGDSAYETEVTYTVVMPVQPVAADTINTFYPYNGWVLRQAGLFCDSRYKLRTVSDDDAALGETTFLNKVNTNAEQSDSAKTWRDSVGGQMLFTRNLSSPILKTPDDEVTFIWHIFITV